MDNLESIVGQKRWLDFTLDLLRDVSSETEFNRLSEMYEKMVKNLGKSEQARRNPRLVMAYSGRYLTVYYTRLEALGENPSKNYSFKKVG